MRMTYRQMVQIMNEVFTEDQWDCDVTVSGDEVCHAYLRIFGDEQDILDPGHPVINVCGCDEDRATELDIRKYIFDLTWID